MRTSYASRIFHTACREARGVRHRLTSPRRCWTTSPLLSSTEDSDAIAARERIARDRDILGPPRLGIHDRDTIRLATLQVLVPVRNAQMADPEMASVLSLFRRAANVIARLEDAIVFRGLARNTRVAGGFAPPAGVTGLPAVWQITGAQTAEGLWSLAAPREWFPVSANPPDLRGHAIVRAVSGAIGRLEENGHFGPFAVVLGQELFLVAQTPDVGSLVMPQDRIIPFLGGGPLLRSSTLDALNGYSGVVVALGGSPIELVVASDVSLQFLQVTSEPAFVFRVYGENCASRQRAKGDRPALHALSNSKDLARLARSRPAAPWPVVSMKRFAAD